MDTLSKTTLNGMYSTIMSQNGIYRASHMAELLMYDTSTNHNVKMPKIFSSS